MYESIGEPLSFGAVHDTVTKPLLAGRPSAGTAFTFVGASGTVAGTDRAVGITTSVVAGLPLPDAL